MILIPSSFSGRMDVFRIGGIWIMGWLYQLKRKLMSNFNVLLDFHKYDVPKRAIFRTENRGETIVPGGRVLLEIEENIIGETKDKYITRLFPFDHGEWRGNIGLKRFSIMPIGIHKSRLVKWV
ncbi:MAG: hypothetical protein IPG12_14290 [Saprospiraceae bacterium]|nr:hypothetical protein [Saprospiraceae bacterium]